MAFISKKRKMAEGKVDKNKAYSLKEASALVKQVNTTNLMLLLIFISVWVLILKKLTRRSVVQ